MHETQNSLELHLICKPIAAMNPLPDLDNIFGGVIRQPGSLRAFGRQTSFS